MNRAQLHAERVAAGKTYVTALADFRKAFIRLAAVERTLQNGHVTGGGDAPPSFFRNRYRLADVLRVFVHPEFLAELPVAEWADPIATISDQQIQEFES